MGIRKYVRKSFQSILRCQNSTTLSDEKIPDNGKQKIIFVLGTGRSGTHWLGYILQAHPNIKATIEEPKIFKMVTDIALDQQKKNKLYSQLIKLYRKRLQDFKHYHYADKSHPNIWIAEDLAKTFDNAWFIGIIRNPYATVASMLRHKDVVKWHKLWKKYPIPNAFLGITEEIAKGYDVMSLPQQCTIRWISHYHQMIKLQSSLNSRLLVISYEDLITRGPSTLKEIKDFLDLPYPLSIESIKKESLTKWKQNLSKKEKDEISQILFDYNLEAYVQV